MAIQQSEIAGPPRRSRPHSPDRCPWCDQAIPHQKFVEITKRLAADEQAKAAVAERRLRQALAKQTLEIEARAAAKVAEAEAAMAAGLAAAEKATVQREMAARIAERKANREDIAASEAKRKAAEKQLTTLRSDQNKALTKQRQDLRASFDKAQRAAIDTEKDRSFKATQRLRVQVEKLQREVDAQRASSSGEGASIDLLEDLKREFPHDRIRTVGGNQGATLIHQVVEDGRDCGIIIYDTHKRRAWRDNYVTRIHKDQLAANADHAIIASTVLPSGTFQLHVEGGVIVANPARTLMIVGILRRHIVQMSSLRLSLVDRSEKSARLYEFIASERFQRWFAEIETGSESLRQLDVDEQNAHAMVWRDRGNLVSGLFRSHGQIATAIDAVVAGELKHD